MGWAIPAAIAGSAAIGGITNYLGSKDAAKARGQEIERMQAIADAMQDPEFDSRMLTPEDYEMAAKYVPELAQFIEEQAPQIVKAASPDAKAGRAMQVQALDKYRQLSQTGDDAQSQILRERALQAAQQQNQGQQEAIKQNFQQRGIGGSGMELVQALMAQQGAGQMGQQASQQAALDAYNRRLDATRMGAQLGGQIRGEDVELEGKNAGIMNSYNQRMAEQGNKYNQYLADMRNEAQLKNSAAKQAIQNANIEQRNKAMFGHQEMKNNQAIATNNAQGNRANVKIGVGANAIGNITQNAADTRANNDAIFGGIIKGAAAYGANQSPSSSSLTQQQQIDAANRKNKNPYEDIA